MIDAYNTDPDDPISIGVGYFWYGSPRPDFTIKVYSVDSNDLVDADGQTNMLYADGREPSEFDYILS